MAQGLRHSGFSPDRTVRGTIFDDQTACDVHQRLIATRIVLKDERCSADNPIMNTKLLILLAWGSYFALRQTADGFWLFCLIYSAVLAICSFFYGLENKPAKSKKKSK